MEYRTGAIGAILDEYERAVKELRQLVSEISKEDYLKIRDTETQDEDCRSIQTIMVHVVHAGYGYANYLRKTFNTLPETTFARTDFKLEDPHEAVTELDKIIPYTEETLKPIWNITDKEVMENLFLSRQGREYDLEQIMEHAIVHILRHRRQIEKFLQGSIGL